MNTTFLNPQQLATEVANLVKLNATNTNPSVVPVTPSEIVHSHPPEMYLPPAFVKLTAGPSMMAELTELLEELRLVNEQHVGQPVLEAVTLYGVTGEGRELSDKFRGWAERYCRLRVAHGPDSTVRNDPFLLFRKLAGECESVFGPIGHLDNSVHLVFLGMAREYAQWLLYTLLWKDRLRFQNGMMYLTYEPAHPRIPQAMKQILINTGWLLDRLVPFVKQLADRVQPNDINDIVAESDIALQGRLSQMAKKLNLMRAALLTENAVFMPVVSVGSDLHVSWKWGARGGIAHLDVAPTFQEAQLPRSIVRELIGVSHDGLLYDLRTPWLTARQMDPGCGFRPLAYNCWLLERFLSQLNES